VTAVPRTDEGGAGRGRRDPLDSFGAFSYRDLIDWPRRLAREEPFLLREFGRAPERSLVDVGCGAGEHARRFASLGFRTVGVDRSPAMIADARRIPAPENLEFVEGDLTSLSSAVRDRFGAALCVGNTLPHLLAAEDLERALCEIRSSLLPGGVLVLQVLNYDRVLAKKIRHLPVSILRHEGGEVVFLRLMEMGEDGSVVFCPTVLRYRADAEPPVEMVESRAVRLRGWRSREIVEALEGAGFMGVRLHGDMAGGPFDVMESQDLVVAATAGATSP
jgi:SAM-dependent methyltransferase